MALATNSTLSASLPVDVLVDSLTYLRTSTLMLNLLTNYLFTKCPLETKSQHRSSAAQNTSSNFLGVFGEDARVPGTETPTDE